MINRLLSPVFAAVVAAIAVPFLVLGTVFLILGAAIDSLGEKE